MGSRTDPSVFEQFRAKYAGREGEDLTFKVRREGQDIMLKGKVRLATVTQQRLEFDPAAGERAARVRHGIINGTTAR